MNGLVEAPFGGEVRRFRLLIGSVEELEDKYDRGSLIILKAITEEGRVGMLRETLRRGLVGAGMQEAKAMMLVEKYASCGVLLHQRIATGLLGHIMVGVDGDQPGKSKPGPETSPSDPGAMGEQVSAPSTEPGQ